MIVNKTTASAFDLFTDWIKKIPDAWTGVKSQPNKTDQKGKSFHVNEQSHSIVLNLLHSVLFKTVARGYIFQELFIFSPFKIKADIV